MDCFLVVVTSGNLPDIPERFQYSHVKLSAPNACIVADSSSTSKDVMELFGISTGGRRGVVVKLDFYSGIESGEIVDKWNKLEATHTKS